VLDPPVLVDQRIIVDAYIFKQYNRNTQYKFQSTIEFISYRTD